MSDDDEVRHEPGRPPDDEHPGDRPAEDPSAGDPSAGDPSAGDPSAEDQRLLAELTRAFGNTALPPGLLDRAAGLLTWRDVAADLSGLATEVTEPGAVDTGRPEPAGARGGAGEDVTTFELPDGSLTVQVMRTAGSGLTGRLHATGPVTDVHLEPREGSAVPVAVDDLGGFAVADAPAGPLRLRLVAAGRVVRTSWFLA